jgi:RimJ/RimL family protein N-acetyltransferase
LITTPPPRITITTFAEERDAKSLSKLHEFLNVVNAGDPQRQPFTPVPLESFARWFEQDYVLADACFIAKHGGRYIGFTDLNHIEPIPGGIMHDFTGVACEHRRQGVATALKLRAIECARERGYQTTRAFNLPAHSAMLALNEKLGFRRRFCYVTVEKCPRRSNSRSEFVEHEATEQWRKWTPLGSTLHAGVTNPFSITPALRNARMSFRSRVSSIRFAICP